MDVLPLFPEKIDLSGTSLFEFRQRDDGFVTVGRVNDRAIAEGPLGDRFGKLRAVRLRVDQNHNQDVVINELIFKVLLVPSFIRPCCEPTWPNPFPNGIPGVKLYNKQE